MKSYITKRAKKFTERHYTHGTIKDQDDKIIEECRSELRDIDSTLDKIEYLEIVLLLNNEEFEKHKEVCTNPDSCRVNYSHETVTYFLTQELKRNGIQSDTVHFNDNERNNIVSILSDLQTLKDGHEIIYEDLLKEIQELKSLIILGKKNWYQLLTGKLISMTAGGVISETVSREIVSRLKDIDFGGLLK